MTETDEVNQETAVGGDEEGTSTAEPAEPGPAATVEHDIETPEPAAEEAAAAAAEKDEKESPKQEETPPPEEETPPQETTGGGGENDDSNAQQNNENNNEEKPAPIVSSSKKSRPPYKFDPNKIVLRFLFANRDGLTVTVSCAPTDTVGEVKGALLSVWPEDLPNCTEGDRLRLVCMGKGLLMPDSHTLLDLQVPIFKTHPTPVNVSVKPDFQKEESTKKGIPSGGGGNTRPPANGSQQTSQGCACVIL